MEAATRKAAIRWARMTLSVWRICGWTTHLYHPITCGVKLKALWIHLDLGSRFKATESQGSDTGKRSNWFDLEVCTPHFGSPTLKSWALSCEFDAHRPPLILGNKE